MHHALKFFFCISILSISSCQKVIEEKNVFHDKSNFTQYIFWDSKIHLQQQFFKDPSGKSIPEGYYKEYYKNGNESKRYVFLNGKRLGTQMEFYSNGKVSRVFMATEKDTATFDMTLDLNGNVITLVGSPLYILENKNPVHYNVDTFGMINKVLNVKTYKTYFSFYIIDPDGKKIYDGKKLFASDEDGDTYMFLTNFNKVGNYIYNAKVELRDKAENIIKKDSIKTTITVIP